MISLNRYLKPCWKIKTVYLQRFLEAKTLTGSYLLNTDSFYFSFEYVIGKNNTITGMYFISRLDHKKLPKKRFKVVRIFMNSSVGWPALKQTSIKADNYKMSFKADNFLFLSN